MRFLVVDDHPLLREALQGVLRGIDAHAQVELAGDCEQGLAAAQADPEIDLLLLDLNLPGLTGIDALRTWRRSFPAVPVVVLSAERSQPTVMAALAAGAAGFVPKSTLRDVMTSALRIVLDGGRYLPADVLAEPVAAPGPASLPRRAPPPPSLATLGLTPRQLDVLRLAADGAPNKVIGRTLGLAERTVKAHITAALRAFKVDSRTQLALEAARLGLGGRRSGPPAGASR